MEEEWGKQDGVEKEWEYNSEPVGIASVGIYLVFLIAISKLGQLQQD